MLKKQKIAIITLISLLFANLNFASASNSEIINSQAIASSDNTPSIYLKVTKHTDRPRHTVSFEYCKKELKGEICKYLGPNQEYDELNLMEKLKYQKAISIIIGTAASLSTPVTVYLLYKLLQSLLNIEPENWVLKIVAVNTGIMFIAGINNYMSQQYYKVKAMNTVKSTLSTENQSVNIKETKKLIITLDKILFEIEK